MADFFQPRFVDLVRNYSSTTGTGNLVLGNAIAGFASFADAVQPDDQFYYSAIGLEKTGETEVGRGTLQPDGSIARDPIGGTLTDFSAGMKAVALVTAAEWFSAIQSRPTEPADGDKGDITVAGGLWSLNADATNIADKMQHVADRTALANVGTGVPAVFLRESGREGVFVWSGSDQSAYVAADANQGIYVAPSSDPTGAAGAWVRKFDGNVNLKWFGAAGTGAPASDYGAISVAVAVLKQIKLSAPAVAQYGVGSSLALYAPSGDYYCGPNKIVADFALHLTGDGSGAPGGAGTQFTFDDGTGGLYFAGPSDASAGWMLERCTIAGGFLSTESENHGIELDWPGTIRDVSIYNFPGDGIYQANDTGAGTGNSNSILIDRVIVQNCRRGFYCAGSDVNAQEVRGITAISNRQAGIWEQGFLGNGHYSHTCATNARTAWNTGDGQQCSYVTYNGHQYACAAGQETWCSANAPSGTNSSNAGWIYWTGGGVQTGIPSWFDGISVRAGGGYIHTGLSNRSGFFSCYSETDQVNQFDQSALIISPDMGTCAFVSNGAIMNSAPARVEPVGGAVNVPGHFNVGGTLRATDVTIGPVTGAPQDCLVYLENTNYNSFLYGRSWNAGLPTNTGVVQFSYGNGILIDPLNEGWKVSLRNNNISIVDVDANRLQVAADKALTLQPGAAPAAPTDGDLWYDSGAAKFRKRQDGAITDLHDLSAAVTPVSVAASGPVTSSGGGLGYASGAGGTVTQAASKSTAVTLDALCGQITMSNAALAAATNAGFMLTNAEISATDAVVVNIASGATAGSYQVTVESVTAGSCRISLLNVSSVTLSEAVVLNFAIIKGVNA